MAIKQQGLNQYIGLSTDTKPSLTDNDIGATFYESDTEEHFFYKGEVLGWVSTDTVDDYLTEVDAANISCVEFKSVESTVKESFTHTHAEYAPISDALLGFSIWEQKYYPKNWVARDGDWLGVSNKATNARLAPQAVGSPVWGIDPDEIFTTGQYTGVVEVTHIYTMTKSGWLKELDVRMPGWTLDGTTTRIAFGINGEYVVENNPILGESGDWVTLAIRNRLIVVGDVITVNFSMYHSVAANEITGGWRSNIGTGIPLNQEYNISNASADGVFVIDHTDLDGVERTTELRGIGVNSIVTLVETGDSARSSTIELTTGDTTPTEIYSTFDYIIVDTGSKSAVRDGQVTNVKIEEPIVVATDYSVIANGYDTPPSFASITTSLYTGGVLQPGTTNAFGINILFQEGVGSEDWDIMATLSAGGGSSSSMDWASIEATIDSTGDDKGLKIAGGQFSVGSPEQGRETVLGSGDSYPVPLAYHFDQANLTGLTITGAIDISEILQSDSGSTTPSFNGTTIGKSLLLGSDYMFGGIKIKSAAQSVMERGDAIAEYLINDGPIWQETPFMSTNSNFPYQQYGNIVEGRTGGSEQCRFGWLADDGSPMGWVKTTLNINGTDITKYWMVIWLIKGIITDGTLEQIKLHSDRWECNADGVTEMFGRARPPQRISFHSATNALKNPDNRDITISPGITIVGKDNRFKTGVDDGLAFIGKVPVGLDTSLPLTISIDWYQDATGTGDVKFDIETVKLTEGFIYDGTGVPDNARTQTITVDGIAEKKRTIEFDLDIYDMLVGDTLVIAFSRNGTDAADTLGDAVVLTGQIMTGNFWR